MAAVSEDEITAGLVVRLDAQRLRDAGGCSTNAELSGDHDRAVEGPHYFLVLGKEHGDPFRWLAVPLFSGSTSGSKLLDEDKKAGYPNGWIGKSSYYSRWQHWLIPAQSLVQASGDEQSPQDDRRTYAQTDHAALDRIAAWQKRNRCDFRYV